MKHRVAFQTDHPEPPMSSLIDIAFLLLIFFIVTTTLLKRETDLDMSMSDGKGPASAEIPVQVTIDQFGTVLVGCGRHMELVEPAGTGLIGEGLAKRIHFAQQGVAPEKLPVILDIHDEAGQQRVIAVLDTFAGLGIDKVSMLQR